MSPKFPVKQQVENDNDKAVLKSPSNQLSTAQNKYIFNANKLTGNGSNPLSSMMLGSQSYL